MAQLISSCTRAVASRTSAKAGLTQSVRLPVCQGKEAEEAAEWGARRKGSDAKDADQTFG